MTQQYVGAALASKVTAEEWAEDHANLLATLTADATNKALFGSFATSHRQDQPILYDELCRVLVSLLDRGILIPEFKSDLADEELEQMRALVAKAEAPKPVAPPTPEETQDREVEQCVVDFKSLSGKQFQQRWMGIKRPIYEAAVRSGRI